MNVDSLNTQGSILTSANATFSGFIFIQNVYREKDIIFQSSPGFLPSEVFLEGDMTLTGSSLYNFPFQLQGNTLYIDGSEEIYIDEIHVGDILSATGNGDSETLKVGSTSYIETNIEQVEANGTVLGFTGRNLRMIEGYV